jgi:hypothetical protein
LAFFGPAVERGLSEEVDAVGRFSESVGPAFFLDLGFLGDLQ